MIPYGLVCGSLWTIFSITIYVYLFCVRMLHSYYFSVRIFSMQTSNLSSIIHSDFDIYYLTVVSDDIIIKPINSFCNKPISCFFLIIHHILIRTRRNQSTRYYQEKLHKIDKTRTMSFNHNQYISYLITKPSNTKQEPKNMHNKMVETFSAIVDELPMGYA